MGDPTAELVDTRCPSCAATLRPGAPWCTLCYADLRPAPEPEPVPVLAPEPVPPTPPPLLVAPPTPAGTPSAPHAPAVTPSAPAPGERPDPTWPCATCGVVNALTLSACAGCGAGFLSGLRASEGPLLELPVVGDLGALSRGQRLGLAAGVVLAVIALVAVLGLLSA